MSIEEIMGVIHVIFMVVVAIWIVMILGNHWVSVTRPIIPGS
jgi:hypothetical protein